MSEGVKVNVMYVLGESAIVAYDDPKADIHPIACIVDREYLGQALPGSTVYISGEAIARSTPYGLDWSVIFPEGLSISFQELQTVMYSKGIVTVEDLKQRSSEIPEIVAQLSKIIAIKLYNLVKRELGG